MKDPLLADAALRKQTYSQAYRIFRTVHEQTAGVLPDLLHDSFSAFPQVIENHPCFPESLGDLGDAERGVVKGCSYWSDASQRGMHIEQSEFAVFGKNVDVRIRADEASDTRSADKSGVLEEWFGEESGHVVVLFFAWKAVLSTKWAGMFPEAAQKESKCVHLDIDPGYDEKTRIEVDLGDVNEKAYHWWRIVLSDGSGYAPLCKVDGAFKCSPWATSLKGDYSFSVHREATSEAKGKEGSNRVSVSEAIKYITEYCEQHNSAAQGLVALYAALLVPMASHYGHKITLPAPKKRSSRSGMKNIVQIARLDFVYPRMDSLFTFSCNVRGVKSLLHSAFYNSDVECEFAGAWLQGALRAVERAGDGGAGTLIMRDPAIGGLWAGAYALGLQDQLFEGMRGGQWEVELMTAGVTGTMESFLQVPSMPAEKDAAQIPVADAYRVKTQLEGIRAVAFGPCRGTVELDDMSDAMKTLSKECCLSILRVWAWKVGGEGVVGLAMPGVRLRKNGDATGEFDHHRRALFPGEKEVEQVTYIPLDRISEVDWDGFSTDEGGDAATKEAVRRLQSMGLGGIGVKKLSAVLTMSKR